jgi:hypothetical protein
MIDDDNGEPFYTRLSDRESQVFMKLAGGTRIRYCS